MSLQNPGDNFLNTHRGRVLVVRAVLWRFADGIGIEVFSFAFFLALGRLLSPDAFGIVSIAGTFIMGCQVILSTGFGTAVMQKADLEPQHLMAALWANLGLGGVCALVVTALAWPLSVAQGKPELLPVMISLTPVLILSSVSCIYHARLRRLFRYDLSALSTSVSIVTGGVVGVSLAYNGAGVWSLVGQQVSATVATLAFLVLSTSWRPSVAISQRHMGDLVRFASKTSLAGFLDFLSRRIDALILGFFLSAHVVGTYFMAARLTTTVSMISLSVAYDLVIAVLPRFPPGTIALREAAHRALQFTMLFSVPAFVGMALLANDVILLLFGPSWHESVRPLQIMCVFSSSYAFTLIGRQVLNSAGCAGISLVIATVNAVLYVVAMLLAAPAGPVAAAAAGGIATSLCDPLVIIALRRKLGLRIRHMLSNQLPVWGATLLMAASVTLTDDTVWLATTGAGVFAVLIVKAAVGFAAFAVALRLLAPELYRAVLGWANPQVPG